jgi:hypothetical protein
MLFFLYLVVPAFWGMNVRYDVKFSDGSKLDMEGTSKRRKEALVPFLGRRGSVWKEQPGGVVATFTFTSLLD